MRLGEVANIKTGLVLSRKRPRFDTVARYNVITVKSIADTGQINRNELDVFESGEEIDQDYLTKAGDIVMRLSEPNSAAYISRDDENLLVTSYCCFIRTVSDAVLPEFLVWYLNSDFFKRQVRKFTTGSALTFLSTQMLKSVELPKMSIEKQQRVINLYKLRVKELQLYQELFELKRALSKGLMSELLIR